MEGSSVAAGSEGYRCEDFGPPSAPEAPQEWNQPSECRTGGTRRRPLQSGSSYTDAQDESPSGRSGRRREFVTGTQQNDKHGGTGD